jgi:uncharacterized protein with PhoU and TrkA domain
MTIQGNSALAGLPVGAMQSEFGVNIVMHRSGKGVRINPGHEVTLAADDTLLVIGPMDRLLELEAQNQKTRSPEKATP